jgi:hypothetical protein
MPSKIFQDKSFLASYLLSVLLLVFSLFVNYYAGIYATVRESNPVTDIILSNTRAYDVDGIFIYGALLMWIVLAVLLFQNARFVPFTLKSISLFIIIRSIFINMTHLGQFPERTTIASNFILNKISFGGDLFFSGHTGLPFLLALIFWKNRFWRYFFLVSSIFFGASVILGHIHYTIDVASAFFITYGIYHLSQLFFAKDEAVFKSAIASE